MVHTTTLHLKVDADSTAAAELAPRVKAAARRVLLTAVALADRAPFDEEALSGAIAREIMAEILRVRQATPAETAIARVRALHREEYGGCAECTHESSVSWPCATIRALNGREQ